MAKTIKMFGVNYEVIKPNTQKARDLWRAFQGSTDVELCDVYGRYSQAKRNAYEYCRAREREFNSLNGVITSYNLFMFTYAFTGRGEDGKMYLVYITPSHNYILEDVEYDKKYL